MADLTIRTILVSVDDLDQAIDFYTNGVGLALKFRDGDHYAALEEGREWAHDLQRLRFVSPWLKVGCQD